MRSRHDGEGVHGAAGAVDFPAHGWSEGPALTIIAAMARPLTFLGGTRQAVIDFIEAHRLP